MPTAGKLEITIKINEFPEPIRTVENAWKEFDIDCDGRIITVRVKPKVFRKLKQAQENYPMWASTIAGKMGELTRDEFILDQPNIQVFERKPKETKPEVGDKCPEPAKQSQAIR